MKNIVPSLKRFTANTHPFQTSTCLLVYIIPLLRLLLVFIWLLGFHGEKAFFHIIPLTHRKLRDTRGHCQFLQGYNVACARPHTGPKQLESTQNGSMPSIICWVPGLACRLGFPALSWVGTGRLDIIRATQIWRGNRRQVIEGGYRGRTKEKRKRERKNNIIQKKKI